MPVANPTTASIVCSGASVGLPGGEEVFGHDNVARILEGENRISHLGDRALDFLGLNLVEDPSQVIRLAGVRSHFDLTEYGVSPDLQRTLDITTRLAMAAGLEALRDAGIPLVPRQATVEWGLPEALRDSTGVIFASAFPGYDQLIGKMGAKADEEEGRLDHAFLFQILAMGHAQFAQFVGARGPSTHVNAACASTGQAICIAEDWIGAGRCDRVVVIAADDVTSEHLLKWIGGGLMAAGVASTEDEVDNAALPFDGRRHGTIVGMGAVGFVLEKSVDCERRGVVPIAELIGSVTANSAFHGSRLDPEHIAGCMQEVVQRAAQREGASPAEMASATLFMSQESYTPARGGSAAAEIRALRMAFPDNASEITIANIKGFTGHAMGAEIEDAVALKALQYGRIPPVANLREPDEQLGDLRLSRGERRDIQYVIRLSAGFGSQVVILVWKRLAYGDARVPDPARRATWLKQVTGFAHVDEFVEQRTLRVVESPVDGLLPLPCAFPPDDVTTQETPLPEELRLAAPPMTPSPPSPAVASLTKKDLRADVLTVIADQTGHTIDELDPDLELEADLDVDAATQARIISLLCDRYALEADDDLTLPDNPTIRMIATWLRATLRARSGAGRTLLPEPLEGAGPVPRRAEIKAPDVLAELLAVIATRTGYAITDLGPGLKLGPDLGIDTAQQARILSELSDRYGLDPDEHYRLTDVPTIADLARLLEVRRAVTLARGPRADDPDAVTLVPDRWGLDTDPSRPGWTPVPDERFSAPQELEEDAEPTWTPAPERQRKPPPDHGGWAWEPVPLPPSFAIRRPVLAERPACFTEVPPGIKVRVIGAGATAEAIRRELTRRGAVMHGPPDAVIDAGVDVLDSLRLARNLDQSRPRRWFAITRLGGLGGEAPSARAFADGARAGFCKSLGREWEETNARVVDIPPGEPEDQVAWTVCDELLCDDGIEVFRRYYQRLVVQYRLEPTPVPGPLSGKPVVVVTGGARGICARVAREIARRGPARLALVGRTRIPDEAVDLATAREAVKAELKSIHRRVTPAMVEERLGPLRRANEVRQTLDVLETLGADALYYTADLSDPRAIPVLLDKVATDLGEVDIVIHGAGHEESQVIAEKDNESFRRVFDGKARGGRALFEALPPSAFVVSMGSVAGRFGSAGRTDYAAANEAMARLCLCHPNALHVAWTAWDDVGMAVRGGMRRWLENRGVDLLPADAGASLLVDLIATRATGELLVAGKLGELLPPPSHPLLDRVEMEGDVVRGYRTLSVSRDPWLADHVIDGTPVLPGVVGVELMTALACRASPGLPPVGAKHVHFDKQVKIPPKQQMTIIVEARPIDDFEVHCSLSMERVLRTGRVQRTENFHAVIILGELMQPDSLPSAFFPDESIPAPAIYERLFHGPRFRVLERATGIAKDGLLAKASADWGAIAPALRSSPLVLEAALQAAGLHRLAEQHQTTLPASLEEVRFVRPPPPDGLLQLMVHYDGDTYDVDVDGSEGAVMRVRGLSLVELEPLPKPLRIPAPPGGRPQCFPDRASSAVRSTPVAVSRRADDATARAVWNEERPEEWLTRTEMDELGTRGSGQRQRDQLAGRIAAKRALSRLTGVRPHTIRIVETEGGEPVAEIPDHPEARVSIAYLDGLAVAMAVSRGRVGIDLERIEHRKSASSEDWFDPSEQALVGDDPERQTLVWTIKEAVLKALGAGLALPPRDVVVRTLGDGGANVELLATAADVHQEVGGGRVIVKWRRDGDLFLVATARLSE
jgi:3-oxoacyl-(acyl-carrier-protein) synthase/NAD(P)-dependent dehydrogenase (short-subunit alcohol dehydrogenase family)/phosphopantetheinyl transferase/acyl carrier protein